MNRLTIIYSVLLLMGMQLFSSCERRSLENDYYAYAQIPVGALWAKAGINPQNVTVLFYDENHKGKLVLEHKYENNSKRIQSYVDLPVGKYTVVLFNELRDQVDYVGVKGYENLSTLEFYTKQDPTVRVRSAQSRYVREPGVVARAIVRGFEVTQEMLQYTRGTQTQENKPLNDAVESLVDLIPLRIMSQLNIMMHVKGLNNTRMPALVDIDNLSGGYMMDANKNSFDLVTHQFTMNNRIYDPNSNKDGTISASLQLFGIAGDKQSVNDQPINSKIILDILFMLVDEQKTIINRKVDITKMITFSDNPDGTTNLNVYIDLTDPLPNVKPEGSTDSGFGTELEDWGVIHVPLISK